MLSSQITDELHLVEQEKRRELFLHRAYLGDEKISWRYVLVRGKAEKRC